MTVLAFDIGGTKSALALVDPAAGAIMRLAEMPTPAPERSGGEFLDSLVDTARSHAAGVEAIGLSLCEIVTPFGEVASGHRVRWSGLPVIEAFCAVRPASVESDVRCAARAEAAAGAGRKLQSFFYINLGTGMSSCLVIEGKPWVGENGSALVLANGPTRVRDTQGKIHEYVLEDIAGGEGLSGEYERQTGKRLAARDVLRAACDGEAAALTIMRRAAEATGMALGHVADLLDPAAIIVGGGLSQSVAYLMLIEEAMRDTIWSARVKDLPFIRAALGADAPLLGAALSAISISQR